MRPATDVDRAAILDHIARAPFSSRQVRVPSALRHTEFRGYRFGSVAPSDLVHLPKRVLEERQWGPTTTLESYVQDLHHAVRHEAARLVVYQAHGLYHARVMSPNSIQDSHLGERPEAYVFVLYNSADGTLTTGYQVSGPATISLPGDARWLT